MINYEILRFIFAFWLAGISFDFDITATFATLPAKICHRAELNNASSSTHPCSDQR